MTVLQEGAAAAMPQDDSAEQFKLDLRDAARAAHFESLRDIEDKTGLSRATVSAAFSPAQPLPSERTIHAVTRAIEVDAQPWINRLRALTAMSTVAPPEGQDATEAAVSSPDPAPTEGPAPLADATTASAVELAVRSASDESGPHDPGAAPSSSAPRGDPSGGAGRSRRLRWVAVAAATVVLLVAGFASGYALRGPDHDALSSVAAPSGSGSGMSSQAAGAESGSGATAVTSAPSGRSFQETVIPENAAPTFKDPLTVRGLGPKVPANTTVTVSCRLFSDAVPSAYPDGYWYRIQSSPWNGDYYAAANAFLNGDPPGDPTQYKHPTDLAVPKC